ncbi:hypothetical protein BH23VER1_BH23VER1_22380 [soil metagenome]
MNPPPNTVEIFALERPEPALWKNIQYLAVTQGPVQRLLGIADLKVETAGGGSGKGGHQQQAGPSLHTAYFRGIDNADEVKELVARRMRGIRDSGLGDHDDASEPAQESWAATAVVEALGKVLVEAKALRRTAGIAG